MEGVIKYINTEKGYGFIELEIDGETKSVFFHVKEFRKSNFDDLLKGDVVGVGEIVETEKGLSAKNVSIVS